MLLYLDQNYASRIGKYLLQQPDHEEFGRLYDVLLEQDIIVPPSPFHALELRGGYLLPVFQEFFPKISKGYWVRPWQDILELQKSTLEIKPLDLLTRTGSWEEIADLSLLSEIVTLTFSGSLKKRISDAASALLAMLQLPTPEALRYPFIDTLSRLLAFRSLNEERHPHDSDLADLVIAATIRPYAPLLATDRFISEGLKRLGIGGGSFSARRHDVLRLIAMLNGG